MINKLRRYGVVSLCGKKKKKKKFSRNLRFSKLFRLLQPVQYFVATYTYILRIFYETSHRLRIGVRKLVSSCYLQKVAAWFRVPSPTERKFRVI